MMFSPSYSYADLEDVPDNLETQPTFVDEAPKDCIMRQGLYQVDLLF